MHPHPQPELERLWRRRAAATARKVNLAWWLEAFSPWLVLGGAFAFATIFWMRSARGEVAVAQAAPWLGGTLALAAMVAWWRARSRFITPQEGLVRLEARLRLHNALSTAAAGRRPWPEPPPRVSDGWRWRWAWLLTPPLAAVLCLLAAFQLPVRAEAGSAASPAQPMAWQQMDQWLATLEREEVLAKDQLQQLRERLETLRDQPREEWFGHQSLEATDHLRESLQASLSKMAADLRNAREALRLLEKFASELSPEARERLTAEFQAALQGLRTNDLKLDPSLMAQLAQVDPSSIKTLSAEQLEQLREAMKRREGA